MNSLLHSEIYCFFSSLSLSLTLSLTLPSCLCVTQKFIVSLSLSLFLTHTSFMLASRPPQFVLRRAKSDREYSASCAEIELIEEAVEEAGFRVWGLGFRVKGLGFRVWG